MNALGEQSYLEYCFDARSGSLYKAVYHFGEIIVTANDYTVTKKLFSEAELRELLGQMFNHAFKKMQRRKSRQKPMIKKLSYYCARGYWV